MAEILINGTRLSNWNAVLLDGSYANLLTPAPLKEWVSNDSPQANGTEYLVPDNICVKERDVTLIFYLNLPSRRDFISTYFRFVEMLQSGILDVLVPDLNRHYYLKYESCTSFDHFNLTSCKIAVKFTEPDPTRWG